MEISCKQHLYGGTRLARELGAGSGEQGAGKKRAGSRDCSKKSRNGKNGPKIKSFADEFFEHSNFSEYLDLLPWV
jgi:hypothetical protein